MPHSSSIITTHTGKGFETTFKESPTEYTVSIRIPHNKTQHCRLSSRNGGMDLYQIAGSTAHILERIHFVAMKRRLHEAPRPPQSVLDKSPQCPVCQNTWCGQEVHDNWGKIAHQHSPEPIAPLQLKCDCKHPICKGCVLKWYESLRNSSDPDTEMDTDTILFRCPICCRPDNEQCDLLDVPIIVSTNNTQPKPTKPQVHSNVLRLSQRGRTETPYTLRPSKRLRLMHR